MNAIRLHAFGPAENLRYEVVNDPEPGPGQVRIAVAAAGVHLIDTLLRAGRRLGSLPLAVLPAVPGREVAGVVDALGAESKAPGSVGASSPTWAWPVGGTRRRPPVTSRAAARHPRLSH